MFLQFGFHNNCCICENILMTSQHFARPPILEDFPGQAGTICTISPSDLFHSAEAYEEH